MMTYDDMCEYLERKILLIFEVTLSEIEASININLIKTNLKKIQDIIFYFAVEIPKINNFYYNFSIKFKNKIEEKLKFLKSIIESKDFENLVEPLN